MKSLYGSVAARVLTKNNTGIRRARFLDIFPLKSSRFASDFLMTRLRKNPDTPDLADLTVNCTMLAALLNISVRRVHQLAAAGTIPAPVAHRYGVVACVQAYVAFLQAIVQQQGSGSSSADLKAARVQLLQVQKKNADLRFQQASGKMLPVDDVEALMLEVAAAFAGQKRSMGSRLAGRLAGMSDPKRILALLNAENDKILRGVSEKFAIGAKRR